MSQFPPPGRYPAQPFYAPAPPRGLSIASLVIGLVSLLAGAVVLVAPPIVGLVLGVVALKREPAGRGMALAGIWINAAALALLVLGAVLIVGLLAVGLSVPFWFDSGYSEQPGIPA